MNKESLICLLSNFKHPSVCAIGISWRSKRTGKPFEETITEKISKFEKHYKLTDPRNSKQTKKQMKLY
jgi:hypothetical protein